MKEIEKLRASCAHHPDVKCVSVSACAQHGCQMDVIGSPNVGQVTIEARETSHGSYLHQSRYAQELKTGFREHFEGWKRLSPEQRETLDMIAVKISRIMNGNPNEADHWTDISGYATLISNLLTKGTPL